MKVPKGKTEQEVLEAIELASKSAVKYRFGYFSAEDMQQQARVFCLESLPKYDNVRPLVNFFSIVIRSRLINMHRDLCKRSDAPCKKCAAGDPCTGTRDFCAIFKAWMKRNGAKAALISPLDISCISDEKETSTKEESSVEEDVQLKEILGKIDRELDVSLRKDYLRMRAGASVPKARKQVVIDAVKAIVGDSLG